MNPLIGITEYLAGLEKKLRLLAWTRGAAIFGGAALLATVLLVMVLHKFSFSDPSVFWGARGAVSGGCGGNFRRTVWSHFCA